MNPCFPFPVLIPLTALAVGLVAIAAWRGTDGLTTRIRGLFFALRILAVSGVLLILFNPGKWVNPTENIIRPWIILADVSSSMTQATGDGITRAATSQSLLRQAIDHADSMGLPLRVHAFSETLAIASDNLPPAEGSSTQLLTALSQVLQDAGAAGESPAGIIVLGDGRETRIPSPTDTDALALRARSRNTAVHAVTIGAGITSPDLRLIQSRSTITAFPRQSLRIPFAIESGGLPPVRVPVVLLDESGAEISQVTLDLPTGKTVTSVFEVESPAQSTRWTLKTPTLPAEVRSANNKKSFHIRVLESKTRVFLAEGAPYWDSKFLAQLLRQQPHMDLQSVHRLSESRYFRIDSGSEERAETNHPVFPATLDELSRYDLIIFGKNVDAFLTPERTEALRIYVRDRGGAVLFARGKPTTGDVAALEPLEPVIWKSTSSSEFRFLPSPDGEAAGLFGQALPAPDSSLWTSLPTLKDGRQISMVKPFTRVLAHGRPEGNAGKSGEFPALLVRRYGQGVTGLVNGDGLWKWDFYPEARELGNCYEDFWIQLIQWFASYSEFLPGHDFSLRLPSGRGQVAAPVSATLSFRGARPAPQPELRITSPSGVETLIRPATLPDASGHPLWRASFTPDAPGDWQLAVFDPREKAPPTPTLLFNVPHPPRESDDLSPDPAFLESISTATGGNAIQPADFADFLKQQLVTDPPASRKTGAVWKPSWNHATLALAIASLLAAEWFLRRRQGLA